MDMRCNSFRATLFAQRATPALSRCSARMIGRSDATSWSISAFAGEYNSPITDQRDRFLTLQPGRQSVVFPDAPVGLLYPGNEGVSRSTYHRDWNNFSPRLGMVWDVLGNGKLAIRGGYGLLYDSPDYQFGAPFITAAPFNITATITSTRYADPWASSLVNPIPQLFPFHPARPGDRFNFRAVAPLTLGYYDPALATPYTQEWSFQVQHQVSP